MRTSYFFFFFLFFFKKEKQMNMEREKSMDAGRRTQDAGFFWNIQNGVLNDSWWLMTDRSRLNEWWMTIWREQKKSIKDWSKSYLIFFLSFCLPFLSLLVDLLRFWLKIYVWIGVVVCVVFFCLIQLCFVQADTLVRSILTPNHKRQQSFRLGSLPPYLLSCSPYDLFCFCSLRLAMLHCIVRLYR